MLLGLFSGGLPAAANLIAICWFGMWMGHTSSNGHLASLKTLMFVQVIPWMVIHFVASLGMMVVMLPMFSGSPLNSPRWVTWWPITNALITGALSLAKDVFFVIWSRNRLYGSFREQATRNLGRVSSGSSVVKPGTTTTPSPPLIAVTD